MRAAAEKEPTLVDAVRDSMEPVKILISDIMCRLQIKGRCFQQLASWKSKRYGTLFTQLTVHWILETNIRKSHCLHFLHWKHFYLIAAKKDTTLFALRNVVILLVTSVKQLVCHQKNSSPARPNANFWWPLQVIQWSVWYICTSTTETHRPSLPVFNMCGMCPWWYNVKSVLCGAYCTHPESSPLLPGKNLNLIWKTTLSHVVLLWVI